MPRRIKGEADRFGARLAALRKQVGISQTALAQEIGVSQRMMAYYEGPRAFAPANRLPALAHALGVSVETLLGTGGELSGAGGETGGGFRAPLGEH